MRALRLFSRLAGALIFAAAAISAPASADPWDGFPGLVRAAKSGGIASINSIQSGTITTGSLSGNANGGTVTATISSVSTSNSVVLNNGCRENGNSDTTGQQSGNGSVTLTNPTTVTYNYPSISTSATTTLSCGYTVLEFKAGSVASIQTGNVSTTLTGGPQLNAPQTGTATITSVNTAKSVLFVNGCYNQNAANSVRAYGQGTLILTNATTVTMTTPVVSNLGTTVYGCDFTVLQFK